jgi:hypothetical protein
MVSQGLDRELFWLAHPAEFLAIRTHTADEIPIVGRRLGNTRKRLAYTSRIRIRTGRLNVGRVHPLPNLPLLSCRETRLVASLTHGKEEKLLVWGTVSAKQDPQQSSTMSSFARGIACDPSSIQRQRLIAAGW